MENIEWTKKLLFPRSFPYVYFGWAHAQYRFPSIWKLFPIFIIGEKWEVEEFNLHMTHGSSKTCQTLLFNSCKIMDLEE